MCSQTRQVNAFGTRMTLAELVGYIQKNHRVTVTAAADMLNLPQVELRAYAFAGVEMDSREASKLGNRIRQVFGDTKITKTPPHAGKKF